MTDPPSHLRAVTADGAFEVQWSGGEMHRLPFRFVRGRCPCAACVDEITGRRVVDVKDVPADVHPTNLGYSGNYALKIAWSDGHDTGLYTWAYLGELAREQRIDRATIQEG